MSYTIDKDGTIRRGANYHDNGQRVNNSGRGPGGGAAFWVILLIVCSVIAFSLGNIIRCNHGVAHFENSSLADSDVVVDTPDVAPATSIPEIDTIVSPPVETSNNWSGTYKATTDAGSTYGGTPINYEITIRLEANDDSYTNYYGSIEVSGYMTYFTYPVTAYANKNILRVRSGHNPDEDVQGIVEDSPIVTLYYYEAKSMIESQWHQGLSEDYINNQTKLSKISN